MSTEPKKSDSLLDLGSETPTPQTALKPPRQAKRNSAFFRMDVESCVDHVDAEADEYADRENFIRAVIIELEKRQ